MNRVANQLSPMTPAVTYASNRLTWAPQPGVKKYKVLKNGALLTTTASTAFPVPVGPFAAYQVVAVDDTGWESFASEPLEISADATARQVQLETVASKAALAYKGFTGQGFIEISSTKNTALTIPVTVPETGLYAVDFRYANGNGPINTNNRCAIRTLRRGPELLGTVVLPQRGVEEWSNWGFSNPVLVRLAKGTHPLTLAYEPANQNMNGEVNQAMLDYLRVKRVE